MGLYFYAALCETLLFIHAADTLPDRKEQFFMSKGAGSGAGREEGKASAAANEVLSLLLFVLLFRIPKSQF